MEKLSPLMTIGEFGEACGVPAYTVRYYESIKLLPNAERTSSGQRRYSHDAVKKLTFIRRCRDFGYSIKQVRALIDLSRSDTEDCRAYRDITQERIDEIDRKVQELLLLKVSLQELVTECEENCIGRTGQNCLPLVK